VAIDPEGAWQDPDSRLCDSLALEPAATMHQLAAALDPTDEAREPAGADGERADDEPADGERADDEPADGERADDQRADDERPDEYRQTQLRPADPDWLEGWRSGDQIAAEAILGAFTQDTISEPRLALELGVLLPPGATLFVASSMPVRDIETFWPVRDEPPRALCNRGANGIDGTVSSAFGAAAHEHGPVVLLIGDVALAHDIGGLLAARRLDLRLAIVLIDNGGGGIFDFLPVAHTQMARATESARAQDIYTEHVATPTGLDFAKAADLYGLAYQRVRTVEDFRQAIERALAPHGDAALIHVRGDRAANVELHDRVWSAVSAAIGDRQP
jgi:2-succinyl-5-enolpyruvyl-6-hydroxy-3-cyclohexene-1-carboxylate synthase